MKRILYRISRWILASMGFTVVASCSKDNGFKTEYGAPYCTYDVKCKIVDSQTKAPVDGLGLVPGTVYSGVDESGSYADVFIPFGNETTNNTAGVYELKGQFGTGEKKMYIKMHDLDANTHGNYKDTLYPVSLKLKEGDEGRWHAGKYEGDITLEATCLQSDKK